MPQMNEAALRGLLGLCQRAGKLQSGGDMALAAIRSGKARVAVVDAQASANTVKKITDACIYYHVPLLTLPDGLLGAACGPHDCGGLRRGLCVQAANADDGGGINSFRAALHKEKFSSITRNAGVQASNDEG